MSDVRWFILVGVIEWSSYFVMFAQLWSSYKKLIHTQLNSFRNLCFLDVALILDDIWINFVIQYKKSLVGIRICNVNDSKPNSVQILYYYLSLYVASINRYNLVRLYSEI